MRSLAIEIPPPQMPPPSFTLCRLPAANLGLPWSPPSRCQPWLPLVAPLTRLSLAARRARAYSSPDSSFGSRMEESVSTVVSASASQKPKPVVLGCGGVSVDYLATVASFPNPDDKIRSLALKVQGGGNTANALTGAARLGLDPRIISKVSNDALGRNILSELQADGVDTSYIMVAEDGNSPFTYIIVDNQTKTRTCIHTAGYPPMVPEELTNENLFAALRDADMVYFDVRLHEMALLVAEECRQAKEKFLFWLMPRKKGRDWMSFLILHLMLYALQNFLRPGQEPHQHQLL